ncbi:MobC family plasmid mobilization relaxosome protein [Eubacteriales bacterium OttesenSCG-928-K08]|nr:MobC family plasmid mobilization relaxosome protein [Eubacteriales bacterium OttesenSCG-928-K08]
MSAIKRNRQRPIQLRIWANEEEAALIQERMDASGIRNFSAFARKMLIDGYHVNIDLSDVREMVVLLRRCSNNINQIAKRANETRSIYAEDVSDLRRQYDTLWDAANKILVGLAKIR